MTMSARRINERAIDVLLPTDPALDRSRLRAGANRPPNALRVPQHAAHAASRFLGCGHCAEVLGDGSSGAPRALGSRRTGVGLPVVG
jgi:hypothetical protein